MWKIHAADARDTQKSSCPTPSPTTKTIRTRRASQPARRPTPYSTIIRHSHQENQKSPILMPNLPTTTAYNFPRRTTKFSPFKTQKERTRIHTHDHTHTRARHNAAPPLTLQQQQQQPQHPQQPNAPEEEVDANEEGRRPLSGRLGGGASASAAGDEGSLHGGSGGELLKVHGRERGDARRLHGSGGGEGAGCPEDTTRQD